MKRSTFRILFWSAFAIGFLASACYSRVPTNWPKVTLGQPSPNPAWSGDLSICPVTFHDVTPEWGSTVVMNWSLEYWRSGAGPGGGWGWQEYHVNVDYYDEPTPADVLLIWSIPAVGYEGYTEARYKATLYFYDEGGVFRSVGPKYSPQFVVREGH